MTGTDDMLMRETLPYGCWPSPLSASWVAGDSSGMDTPRIHRGVPYWVEKRPEEDGAALMSLRHGKPVSLLDEPWHPGSQVHEVYAGTVFTVGDEGVHFINKADQRLCHLDPTTGEVTALTPATELRLVDPVVDNAHDRVLAVAERHGVGPMPDNLVVAIPLHGGPARDLIGGADFYSGVRPSPDGSSICWISWSHPDMPWNGSRLWVADVDQDGEVSAEPALIAGGEEVSVACPLWDAEGTLWFASDATGWWNLYRWSPAVDDEPRILHRIDADCTRPPWEVGHRSYVPTGPDSALVVLRREGLIELVHLSATDCTTLDGDYIEFGELAGDDSTAVTIAKSSTRSESVVGIDLQTLSMRELHHDGQADPDQAYVSIAETITYPTEDGEVSHGYYYPPANPRYDAPAGDHPPLLITVHGGPTSAARPSLNRTIQFFTSRGFAVVDLNYRGSTGFGRAYWQRLYGNWGKTDVEDCVFARRYLAKERGTDPHRSAVRGGSAGGFTALAALAFTDDFGAGVSYYGVSDLALMEQETHKFESRYTTRLVCGDDGDPQLLNTRSPIHSASEITAPVLFLQGSKDPVVPPNQSQLMRDALASRGVPSAYLEFSDESHGFSHAKSTQRSLEAELTFYAKVFGLDRNDLTPLDIEPATAGV